MASVGNVILETRALTKRFGGLEAIRSVDFKLERGELRAIIGPNGAGKTTFVSMISGRIRPSSGRIFFEGRDITKMKAHDRAGMGIVYTFQIINIFRNLPVYENVSLAVQRRLAGGGAGIFRVDEEELHREVDAILERIGLRDVAEQEAGSLPYGHQRLLDIGLALALNPKLLILDEPTQGLAINEIDEVMRMIRELHRERTIMLIEHNMQVVLELAKKITVMDKGTIIAEGTPEEIEGNIEVQKVYLGL
ncbi:MAG: ABC transporter ATP-binding protein [Aigarchaeota archaeon]|nr:ABC transporter ATP-binding protein [Candidatus Pelearchaeum maunauluense]